MTKLLIFLITIYLSPEPTFQKFSCVHSNNDKKINWKILSKHFPIQAATESLDSSSDICYNKTLYRPFMEEKGLVREKDVTFLAEIWEINCINA